VREVIYLPSEGGRLPTRALAAPNDDGNERACSVTLNGERGPLTSAVRSVPAAAGSREAEERRESSVLVLTRKTNQSIMIGDEIEVSVLSVAGEKVRIGIDAPRSVAVFRKEVYEAPSEPGRDAGPGSAADEPGEDLEHDDDDDDGRQRQ
jgi:carbon storage regulator